MTSTEAQAEIESWYESDAKFTWNLGTLAASIQVTEGPEVPPPVWDDRPIDADKAMAAVRALSGG